MGKRGEGENLLEERVGEPGQETGGEGGLVFNLIFPLSVSVSDGCLLLLFVLLLELLLLILLSLLLFSLL